MSKCTSARESSSQGGSTIGLASKALSVSQGACGVPLFPHAGAAVVVLQGLGEIVVFVSQGSGASGAFVGGDSVWRLSSQG